MRDLVRAGPGRIATLLACALAACTTHHPAATTPRPAPGPDVPPPTYYASPGPVPTTATTERIRRTAASEHWEVALPARVHPEVAHVPHVEDDIRIWWYRPRPVGGPPRPLVVMMPILSNRSQLMREFGSAFVHQGYEVAVVPRKEVAFDPRTSIDGAEDELRVLVMRVRQAIDWLVRQPQVDGARIGVFGISAGGVSAACLMAADPRIDAGVFVFAGGPTADVMVDTVEGHFTRKTEAVHRELGWDREELRRRLRQVIRTDPVRLAPRVRREDVLMFLATEDESVPTRHQWRLWEALGRPALHEIPAGHYRGVALYLPFLVGEARDFLGRRLGPP